MRDGGFDPNTYSTLLGASGGPKWLVLSLIGRVPAEQFVAAITGADADRAALETVRAEKLADMTVASEQILTSLADVAGGLTPERRVELAQMAERWHH
ncbi:MAG: hypothetical protein P8R42_28170 [Candidatus Binatia bacterium]|nr:hypothetical protein [Candidatus Binatia bacterium]